MEPESRWDDGLVERSFAGLEALEAMTQLMQRVRIEHPTAGLYEAAEIQWWWRVPRSTDAMNQLFWYDEDDRPVAGAYLADFGGGASNVYDDVILVPSWLPDTSAGQAAHIIERALAVAADQGVGLVKLEVDRTDEVTRGILSRLGFEAEEEEVIAQGWLSIEERPEISPLPSGYRLASRAETSSAPHHMTIRNPETDEERLAATSLYRNDLDLVVLTDEGEVAAYALFWNDSVSATGVVEPVRTMDDHQGRGLARHLLSAGIDRLAAAGAQRVSITWEPGPSVSGHLYRSLGFVPEATNDLWAGKL